MLALNVLLRSALGQHPVDTSLILNRTITGISMDDKTVRLDFDTGKRLEISDKGQTCCESRYLTTDDDLEYHVGAVFLGAEVADGSCTDYEYETHEIQFLNLKTSRGVVTIETHNEHNGYYGGFFICPQVVDIPEEETTND